MTSFRWTEGEVRSALGLPGGDDTGKIFPRVSTDTRNLQSGDLFVALRGDRFDAHEFLSQAAEAGATGAVVERLPAGAPVSLTYFEVGNSLHALGALARHRRERSSARVVGVVGSNGKTTTKDLIRAALEGRFRVHATQGNLNNQIGVPLTLLSAPESAEILVVEMGTNEPGEIAILTAIVQPDAAVVTSIGEEHLEKLVDLEGVLREESAILSGLKPGAAAFVAEEPEELPRIARERVGSDAVRVAGFSVEADLRPDGGIEGIELQSDGSTRWRWHGAEVHLPIPGRLNVRNALLALGLARHWGMSPDEAAQHISRVPRPKLRGEWHEIGGIRVLADCYNANPPSTIAAVELLAQLPAEGDKVAVLGTMRELGDASETLHQRTAETVARSVGNGIGTVVATGVYVEAFRPFADALGDRLVLSVDPIHAYEMVTPRLSGRETILLKASRGEALERWIPLLERDFGSSSK